MGPDLYPAFTIFTLTFIIIVSKGSSVEDEAFNGRVLESVGKCMINDKAS